MSLSDEELDLLSSRYGDREVLFANDTRAVSVDAACAQAKEANRLRAALKEALDGWSKYVEDRRYDFSELDRIAELRKLVTP